MTSRSPLEIDASRQPPLGMPPTRFLRDYWQKRPLLIRNAMPGFVSPVSPDELAGLACEELALSRLVRHDRRRDRYTVESGPFSETAFVGLPERDWTLLVQDVDKWDTDVGALLRQFDFLPRWRIDDVMVSFAAPGGSVGAHVDQYDVFLLQAMGRRRWWIDDRAGVTSEFRDDSELRLLRRFTPNREWLLEPGDMLYLPPGMPHHGVAEPVPRKPRRAGAADVADRESGASGCLTFSFGMRAPSQAEMLLDLAQTLASALPEQQRYADPDLVPATDSDEIDAAALARVRRSLAGFETLPEATLRDWFGAYISRYRSAGDPARPARAPSEATIDAALTVGGRLVRHPLARMAWARAGRGARLYVNGEVSELTVTAARRLCQAQTLNSAELSALTKPGRVATIALVRRGIYVLERARGRRRTKLPRP